MQGSRTIAATPVVLAAICSCFYLPPGNGIGGGGGGGGGGNEVEAEDAHSAVTVPDATVPVGERCSVSSDCGTCGNCVNGTCAPPPPGSCVSNADCPGTTTCMDNCECLCASGACCLSSSDCTNSLQGMLCLPEGMCGCESNADCPLGNTCVENLCSPCSVDSDCPQGWACSFGQCDPLPLPCFCPHPNRPVCASGTSVCVQCASDQDCDADAGTGVCDLLRGTCGACGNNELVCPPGTVCNDDVCVTVGSSCPDGGMSIGGLGANCAAECPLGGVCDAVGDCCLDFGSVEGSCVTDEDCAGFPGDLACFEGSCVPCSSTDPGSCQANQSCWSVLDICVLGLDGGVVADAG